MTPKVQPTHSRCLDPGPRRGTGWAHIKTLARLLSQGEQLPGEPASITAKPSRIWILCQNQKRKPFWYGWSHRATSAPCPDPSSI